MARDNSGNMGQWSMLDGVISNHIAPNGSMSKQSPDLKTIEEYQDFELTLDYQIASNANSGIFLRGNVEIQLVGKDHPNSRKPITANGSIYNHFSPLVDPSKPAEQWNKMYIRYQGSEITARINDFTIHNGRTVKQETSNKRSLPNPENFTGPIILQNHTGKISFRNIRIRPITTL